MGFLNMQEKEWGLQNNQLSPHKAWNKTLFVLGFFKSMIPHFINSYKVFSQLSARQQ